MQLSNKQQTHDAWAQDLWAPGRKLTLAEFQACELASIHELLGRIHDGLGLQVLNENGTGGSLEQVRNLLDRFVGAVTVPRPPPAAGVAPPPANLRHLPTRGARTQEEGG
jgi:hypothetical protein